MSLAALTRFGPLFSLLSVPMNQITNDQLAVAVEALSGGQNPELLDLFRRVRDEDGQTLVQDALKSPVVKRALNSFADRASQESMLVCECPYCARFFEAIPQDVRS